jgi:HSP20 family protein
MAELQPKGGEGMATGYRLGTWDPFHELGRLQEEVNRLFSGVVQSTSDAPPINIYAGRDDVIVMAEVPGANPEDVKISVVDTTVTLAITRELELDAPGKTFHRRERTDGKMTRTLQLPFRVDADRVEAQIRKGVLQVRLPRSETDKPRTIAVKPA